VVSHELHRLHSRSARPIWTSFYPWPLSTIGRLQERWTHWLYRNVPFWTACESTRDDLKEMGFAQVTIIRYGVNTVALPELPRRNEFTTEVDRGFAIGTEQTD